MAMHCKAQCSSGWPLSIPKQCELIKDVLKPTLSSILTTKGGEVAELPLFPDYEILEALGLQRIKNDLNCTNDNNNKREKKNNNIESKDFREKLGKLNESRIKPIRNCKNHSSKIPYCKICSERFESRRLLLKHKLTHTGEKPYHCVHCNEKFGNLEAATGHLCHDEGKLAYTCKLCKMNFGLSINLINHGHSVHLLHETNDCLKMYKCEDCCKRFRKFCDLERHVRVHTGEKPYTCKICKNRFQQAHNLTKHMIIHTKEKQFECDICKRQFGRSDVLTRHMVTHTINKPHPCLVCKKSFGRFSQLIDHFKKYHSSFDYSQVSLLQ